MRIILQYYQLGLQLYEIYNNCSQLLIMAMAIPDNLERRVAPRYEDRIQVDLVLPDDIVLPVEICGISCKGLQLTCDGWLADEIEPQGIQQLAMNRKELKISANLPFDTVSKNIIIHSNVVAVRRLSQDKFLIGLEYSKIEDDGEEILDEYLEQLKLDNRN